MKKCYKCKLEKDESEFGKCSAKKSGLNCYCKSCVSIAANKRYLKKQQENIEPEAPEQLKLPEYVTALSKNEVSNWISYLRIYRSIHCGLANNDIDRLIERLNDFMNEIK